MRSKNSEKMSEQASVTVYRNKEGQSHYVVKFHDERAWEVAALFNPVAYPPNLANLVNMCSDRLQVAYSNLKNIFECHRVDLACLKQAVVKDKLGLSAITVQQPIPVVYASSKMLSYLLGFFASAGAFLDGLAKLSGALLTNGTDMHAPGFTGGKFNYVKWLKTNTPESNEILEVAKEMSLFYKDLITIRHNLIHCNHQENFYPMHIIYVQHLNLPIKELPITPWKLNNGQELLDYLTSVESKTRSLIESLLSLHPPVKKELLDFNKQFDFHD